MAGNKEIYEKTLAERKCRCIAMQVLAAGSLRPKEAIEYIGTLPKIESVLFGASSKYHIQETKELIENNLFKS